MDTTFQRSAGIRGSLSRVRPVHLLAAAAAGLLIAHAVIATTWLHALKTGHAASADAQVARRALRSAPTESTESLQAAVKQAQGQVALAQTKIPSQVFTTPFMAQLFAEAVGTGVRITAIHSAKPVARTLGGERYVVSRVSVQATGSASELTSFLATIEGHRDQTLVVTTAQLSDGEEPTLLAVELELYARGSDAAKPGVGGPQ